MKPYLLAGLFLLLLASLAGTFYQTGNVKREKAVADSLRNLRIGERRVADRLDEERLVVIRLTHDRLRQAEEEKTRVLAKLETLESETATIEVVVHETQTGCPPEHIQADSMLAVSHAREKTELRRLTALATDRGDAWKMRALAAETTLEARTLECLTCRDEANAWRRAANPGWFTRFRRSLPQTLLTAGGVLVLAVLL